MGIEKCTANRAYTIRDWKSGGGVSEGIEDVAGYVRRRVTRQNKVRSMSLGPRAIRSSRHASTFMLIAH